MGHVADTYNDVHSLGIEKLRQECAASGLCIRPRQQISRLETIKEVLRAIGEDPDKPPHKRSSNRTGRIHDHTIRPRKPPHPDPATIPQPTTTNSPTSTYSKKHRHRKPPKTGFKFPEDGAAAGIRTRVPGYLLNWMGSRCHRPGCPPALRDKLVPGAGSGPRPPDLGVRQTTCKSYLG